MPTPSPHRHISFTAHYTGYIWVQLGWSHPALASKQGRRLAALMHPLELLMERFVGGSMRSTLKQRHSRIDQQLTALIEQHPDLQVLEIAAGLSPRGWRFLQKYPQLRYVEADLPDMANAKKRALGQIDAAVPQVFAVDLFSAEWHELLKQFDPNRPLVIISEGLVNYFTLPMLHDLWSRIAQGLTAFPWGVYLTDIYPEPTQHRLAKLIWNSSKLLKVLSRSAFSFHFATPQALQDAFAQAGFGFTQVFQPSQNSEQQPSSEQHLGDLVWVVQAQTTH